MAAVLDAPPPVVTSVTDLRTRFRDGKAALLERFLAARASAPAAATLLRALSRHVDETLAALWSHAGMPDGTALLAVGGYGRGEVGSSRVDLQACKLEYSIVSPK